MAKITHYKDPEIAFTAGLLRDIGKLIIHEYVGNSYKDIVNMVHTENITFSAAEERVLGFNHSQIGAEVANKWYFPQILVDTIRYHHSPDEAATKSCEDIKLVSIVHVADSFTMMFGTGVGNDGLMYNLQLKSLENLGIPQQSANVELLMSELMELNGEIKAMVGIVDE